MTTVLNRRERVRAATVTEIKQTARQVLVAEGPEGLSLRAIAREMGMTAPALYRYFPSREDLLVALIGDLYGELTAALEAARDALPATDPMRQLTEVSRTFRHWALANPREFGLLFGSPIPGVEVAADPAEKAASGFGQVFGALVAAVFRSAPFPVPADDDIDPALREQLRAWSSAFPVELPLGAAQVFLSCWTRLYGMVAMEVFGHLHFALTDAQPLFEVELLELTGKLGRA